MYRFTASALPARNVIVVGWSEIHNIWCPSFRIPTSFLVIRMVVTSKLTAWLNSYGGYLLVPFYSISVWCIFSDSNYPRRSPVAVFIIYSCTFTWTKISWELFQLQVHHNQVTKKIKRCRFAAGKTLNMSIPGKSLIAFRVFSTSIKPSLVHIFL